ncbi:MAG TPA: pentapeptide repeat-containing protein [Coxiellaceae bacterium]|nr:MAG: hypothetical protein A3E81_05130 [Gammaproteobacteria bacterium RIFCSPHIGHO2_12_FULL_36_30]HLB55858.1 pentapeptide repeat-containing protein [Coxiellaceae bacterium]
MSKESKFYYLNQSAIHAAQGDVSTYDSIASANNRVESFGTPSSHDQFGSVVFTDFFRDKDNFFVEIGKKNKLPLSQYYKTLNAGFDYTKAEDDKYTITEVGKTKLRALLTKAYIAKNIEFNSNEAAYLLIAYDWLRSSFTAAQITNNQIIYLIRYFSQKTLEYAQLPFGALMPKFHKKLSELGVLFGETEAPRHTTFFVGDNSKLTMRVSSELEAKIPPKKTPYGKYLFECEVMDNGLILSKLGHQKKDVAALLNSKNPDTQYILQHHFLKNIGVEDGNLKKYTTLSDISNTLVLGDFNLTDFKLNENFSYDIFDKDNKKIASLDTAASIFLPIFLKHYRDICKKEFKFRSVIEKIDIENIDDGKKLLLILQHAKKDPKSRTFKAIAETYYKLYAKKLYASQSDGKLTEPEEINLSELAMHFKLTRAQIVTIEQKLSKKQFPSDDQIASYKREKYFANSKKKPGEYSQEDLKRKNFSNKDCGYAKFDNLNLNEVNFRGAKLHGATFQNATLNNADLCDAKFDIYTSRAFDSADFTGAKIDTHTYRIIEKRLSPEQKKQLKEANTNEQFSKAEVAKPLPVEHCSPLRRVESSQSLKSCVSHSSLFQSNPKQDFKTWLLAQNENTANAIFNQLREIVSIQGMPLANLRALLTKSALGIQKLTNADAFQEKFVDELSKIEKLICSANTFDEFKTQNTPARNVTTR